MTSTCGNRLPQVEPEAVHTETGKHTCRNMQSQREFCAKTCTWRHMQGLKKMKEPPE